MKVLNRYSKFIPYFYFLTVIISWFTYFNKNEGLIAYPILLCAIPFFWQIIKPNDTLNFFLGLTFVCISSYLILAYITNVLIAKEFGFVINGFILGSGLFVALNFLMALWILKNSTSYQA